MFTSGKWKAADYNDPNDFYILVNDTEIVKVYSQPCLNVNIPTRLEAKANTQLIAAAPELLKTLQTIRQTLWNLGNGDLTGHAKTIALNTASYAASAIDKAIL